MNILVTGSSGLIGGQAVEYFSERGHTVTGIDNNQRMEFFGHKGDTAWNRQRLVQKFPSFRPLNVDIRVLGDVKYAFGKGPFDAIIHCAAQPSHDWAAKAPLTDFAVNAQGTLNMLEAYRTFSPNAHFIFTSTNKVYGDAPNELGFIEFPSRYDMSILWDGFNESTRIDQSLHSVFGASKLAADLMVQEYGRYFGLKTTVFRCGCLTGPQHSGVQLHGFLSYLVKCIVHKEPYIVYGYKGKQVRDNIHSWDVINAFNFVIDNPYATPGAVYNLGGGRKNSISMMEAIDKIKVLCGNWDFAPAYSPEARKGDHICYITDNTKFQTDYPQWFIKESLEDILNEIIKAEEK